MKKQKNKQVFKISFEPIYVIRDIQPKTKIKRKKKNG